MKTLEFTIPGEPNGKARPRVVRAGNFTKTYTPEQTVVYENAVRLACTQAMNGHGPFGDVPLCAQITARFGIPKSASRQKAQAMLARATLPMKKPDADNIAKIILDALNGVAYRDDAQIVCLVVRKLYDYMPGVDVRICERGTPIAFDGKAIAAVPAESEVRK